jgi:hypothetical protein
MMNKNLLNACFFFMLLDMLIWFFSSSYSAALGLGGRGLGQMQKLVPEHQKAKAKAKVKNKINSKKGGNECVEGRRRMATYILPSSIASSNCAGP